MSPASSARQRGDLRIERVPGPPAHDDGHLVGLVQHALDSGVARHVDDAQRKRDVLPRCPPERTGAVPALGQVREQRRHGCRQPDALREHLGHLAGGGQMRPQRPHRPRRAAGDLEHAARRGDARRRQRTCDAGRVLRSRSEQHRQVVLGHAAAEDLRGELRVGRATRVEEQARVVRLAPGLDIDAQAFAETHGEQRALQAVLERQPHPEIRCEAEAADDLGGPDTIGVRSPG